MFKKLKVLWRLLFPKEISVPGTPVVSAPYEPSLGSKIAVCLGHSATGADKGAYGNGTNEVEYNSWVMDYIDRQNLPNVKTYKGSSSFTSAVSARGNDIVIQLHLNAATPTAHGCEVLVIKGDDKSYPLAEKFSKEFTEKFDRTMRRPYDKGKKILGLRDRGRTSLSASGSVQKILVEPFFITNPKDFVAKEDYAEFMVDFIKSLS